MFHVPSEYFYNLFPDNKTEEKKKVRVIYIMITVPEIAVQKKKLKYTIRTYFVHMMNTVLKKKVLNKMTHTQTFIRNLDKQQYRKILNDFFFLHFIFRCGNIKIIWEL